MKFTKVRYYNRPNRRIESGFVNLEAITRVLPCDSGSRIYFIGAGVGDGDLEEPHFEVETPPEELVGWANH